MLLLAACTGAPPVDDSSVPAESAESGESAAVLVEPYDVDVSVLLDGEPAADTIVMQGGGREQWGTDADGRVTVHVDPLIVGDQYVVAAHPEARIGGEQVSGPATITISLARYDSTDNPAYENADPGGEDVTATTTAHCSHCHVTIQQGWYGSPHRTSASNPTVQDLYAGTGEFDASDCAARGGEWGPGVEPGTGLTVDLCVVGEGVLPDTDGYGACADCHAPGIDGELGGRDLLEATGIAYESGVHCDVCHHVSAVDLSAPAGVAGRLQVVRPSEPAKAPGMGIWLPLTFGPYVDVINPRMGSVYRELFHESTLCAGCHELLQGALVAFEVDRSRWPDGTLPIHSTYSEWEAGPMNPGAPCQSCHMPPMPDVGNSADLYNLFDASVGVAGGWERAPGTVRAHSFVGPRQDAGMLEAAASLEIVTTIGEEVVVEVTVSNVGPGHAIPTGEPLRTLILLVEATCEGEPLVAVGGDVVPDFGGAEEVRDGGDWSLWPDAAAGDVLRVLRRTGEFRDYEGVGRFGDGSFNADDKGMPVEEFVGEARVLANDAGVLTLDAPLPEGDVAYRTAAQGYAGAPGFGFARVLVGADGARMVPHFLAVDVASDNRILPIDSWTSTHRFPASCSEPVVHATLLHRDYPLDLSRERGWVSTDRVMAEATR